jgi:hypothetical protein
VGSTWEWPRPKARWRTPPSRRRALTAALLLAVVLQPQSPASAAPEPAAQAFGVEVHGFVSPGFILTFDNNYLAKSKRGSFEIAEVGINFTVPLTEKLRTGLQLFARDLGPLGNYDAKLDWFYLDYHWEDWLGFRAGRVKIPFGLYNDTSDIDAARVPVLLPQSLYSITSRDYLLAQTGAEVYGFKPLGHAGALDYRLFGGTIYVDPAESIGAAATLQSIDVPYVVGGRLLWETPIRGLRVGGSLEALRLEARYVLPGKPAPYLLALPAILSVGSLEYSAGDLLVAAEYGRWRVGIESSDQSILANGAVVSERGYGMLAYRLTPWLQPGVYYSEYYPNVDHRSARADVQRDLAATLRFDLNPHWLIKLEGHYLRGTASLQPALNDNVPLSALAPTWAAILVKTTAYF